MYECPNCAGNLKFDIASQQLYCEHCETQVDPYSIPEEADAEETVMSTAEAGVQGTGEKKYLVTVFTCPQCGAELLSEDNTAATFCSFCGSADHSGQPYQQGAASGAYYSVSADQRRLQKILQKDDAACPFCTKGA